MTKSSENELIYDIAFSYDQSITPFEKIMLFNRYGSSRKIFELNNISLKNLLGRKWTGASFLKEKFIQNSINVFEYLIKCNVKIVKFCDAAYPESLKAISNSPFLLYIKGDIDFNYNKSIAIVGTRFPDNDGVLRTSFFADNLINQEYTIISGLAKGIDTIAHKRAVDNSAKTIAVLGCGIDRIYPFENRGLAKNIIEKKGALVSEYPPGFIPSKWHFPRRNRIIVGLSRFILITQSPEKSGTLITAHQAIDFDKKLFVIDPGNFTEKYRGNKNLIFIGGIAVKDPEQLLFEINKLYYDDMKCRKKSTL